MSDSPAVPPVVDRSHPGHKANPPADHAAAPHHPAKPQVPLLLTVVFVIYLGQMTLNPVIAPLARAVNLQEWQIGATISTAALMVVLTSQFWGHRSQSWGRKPVLTAAFVVGIVSMTLFALTAWLGMTGALAGAGLFILFVLLRGVGFGTAIAAVPPTAQAYIADVTYDEADRVKGMAGVAAMQGIAMIVGAALGGALAAAHLLAPVVVVPLLLLAGLILLLTRLAREPEHELVKTPVRVSPFDARVWPFLLAGFGILTSLGFIQIIVGFIVQDRLHLDANMTGFVTGGLLVVSGLGLALAQTVIVPKTRWSPPMLLRVGGLTGLLGFLGLIPDAGPVALFATMLVLGIGIGMAVPGYTAGPTLLVSREEQGGLAGLNAAMGGLTFVIAPVLATGLYAVWPPLPVLISAAIMALVVCFVILHPRLRHTAPARVVV